METLFALIKNGKVENIIVADDKFIDKIKAEWDFCVHVDNLSVKPSIGWAYDGVQFTPIVAEPPPVDAILERLKLKKGTIKDLGKAELDAVIEDIITKIIEA